MAVWRKLAIISAIASSAATGGVLATGQPSSAVTVLVITLVVVSVLVIPFLVVLLDDRAAERLALLIAACRGAQAALRLKSSQSRSARERRKQP
jgi:hypothetical protein